MGLLEYMCKNMLISKNKSKLNKRRKEEKNAKKLNK
jgi:hypothetical protein